ncbi:MAG: S8 family serine peptidase [Candidatus Hermodarchaeota archaeon]
MHEAAISSTLNQVSQAPGTPVKVLIETNTRDYSSVTSQITALGGKVTSEFKYAQGLAAEVPVGLISVLRTNPNVKRISLDEMRSLSAGVDLDQYVQADVPVALDSENYEVLPLAIEDLPETYYNYMSMGAQDVWDNTGIMGEGSLAVIIDTGVQASHVMFSHGNVIGGVDLSYDQGTGYEGWDADTNHWHGTHVGGILAGAAALILPEDDLLALSWEYHTGMVLPWYDEDLGLKLMPLLGMAPMAEIFAIKCFDHTGGSIPESLVIDSIEYAIWMHEYGGYDVDIISMSLGGGNGYDGRDLEDQTIDYATSIGITVSTSNGNAGPGSITTGSPATAFTSIGVGAVAHPVNTRIYWDVAVYGSLGIGDLLFTSDIPQIFYYSSRGPTADGRMKPTLSATGIMVLSAFTGDPGALGWASGTSMACPAVSGAIALMNSWGEAYGASPYDYKQALVAGADWLPMYDEYDQGAGMLNAWASLQALMSDPSLGDAFPTPPWWWPVSSYTTKPKGINTHVGGTATFTYDVVDLAPGDMVHFYFEARELTDEINVEIDVTDLGVDLGLNSFEFYVYGPVRSSDVGAFLYTVNVWDDASFTIRDFSTTWSGDVSGVTARRGLIGPGYWRVILENDWTSYDSISGSIKISTKALSKWAFPWCPCLAPIPPDEVYSGTIGSGEVIGWFPVGFGPNGVKIEFWWKGDWKRYPTSDLDMYIYWFDGADWHFVTSGASYLSPEGVWIDSPDVQWVDVLLDGYETYGFTEYWTLKVYYM